MGRQGGWARSSRTAQPRRRAACPTGLCCAPPRRGVFGVLGACQPREQTAKGWFLVIRREFYSLPQERSCFTLRGKVPAG